MADRRGPDEVSGKGCLPALLVPLMIQGGVLLLAWALHAILATPSRSSPASVAAAVAGVLLLFAGPRVGFAAAGARVSPGWRDALAALPDFAMAGAFVVAWAAPERIGIETAKLLAAGMVVEFVVIHASAVVVKVQEGGPVRGKALLSTIGLLALYSLFAAGVSLATKSVWLFVGFWTLFANKFLGDWLTPAGEREQRTQRHMARWGASAALYLVLAGGSVFIPVPELGATFRFSDGDGLWEQHPERVLAMGALYYALLGFYELYGTAQARPTHLPPA